MDNINADRSNLSEAIRGLEMDVQRLEHELQDSEDKMRMIVQHPGDQDSLSGGGKFPVLMDKKFFLHMVRISSCLFFCSKTGSIRDDLYWTFTKKKFRTIELFSINKVSLICYTM